VWYAGAHSDVGGGREDDEGALARVTFEWMLEGVDQQRMREGLDPGLCFDQKRLAAILEELPKFTISTPPGDSPLRVSNQVKVHSSLWPLWWIAELLPRLDIKNLPPKPYRVLAWTPFQNGRKPEKLMRYGRISVHDSVRLLQEQTGYRLSFDNPHYVDSVPSAGISMHSCQEGRHGVVVHET
jgi:hypothetical protein